MTITGRIIEEQKNYYVADTPDGTVLATASGGIRNKRMRISTGDLVDLQMIDATPPRGIIEKIHPRTSFINRPALANCSHLFCICTVKEPPLNLEMLDRLLFTALAYHLQPCIILNKTDLHTDKENDFTNTLIATYQAIGIASFTTSAVQKKGIDAIVDFCKDRTTAFAGLSGVGKTSLLSCIFPDKALRIGELSAAQTRGTHTTTNVTLLSLGNGGYIADTPGIAFVDLPLVPEEDVSLYFGEISDCIGQCRFNNCRHQNEPGCAVLEKVTSGAIASWRHRNYLRFREEMVARKKLQY